MRHSKLATIFIAATLVASCGNDPEAIEAGAPDPNDGPMHALCYAAAEPFRIFRQYLFNDEASGPEYLEQSVELLAGSLEEGHRLVTEVYDGLPEEAKPFADFVLKSHTSMSEKLRSGVDSDEDSSRIIGELIEVEDDVSVPYYSSAIEAGCAQP